MMKAYASGGGGAGSQNRAGTPSNRNANMPQRRGNQSMSSYYRNGGRSALGGNSRTRGRATTIRPAR